MMDHEITPTQVERPCRGGMRVTVLCGHTLVPMESRLRRGAECQTLPIHLGGGCKPGECDVCVGQQLQLWSTSPCATGDTTHYNRICQ